MTEEDRKKIAKLKEWCENNKFKATWELGEEGDEVVLFEELKSFLEQETSPPVKVKEIKKGYCLCGREVKNYKLETYLQCFKETHTLCKNCCWKDRCSDEDCNHRYRPECTECNGRGWIVKPQVIRSFTTEELNEELERRDPPPMSDELDECPHCGKNTLSDLDDKLEQKCRACGEIYRVE